MWVVEDMQRDTVDRFASDRNGQDTFALGWLRTANECLCLPRMRFCQQQMLRAQLPQQGQLGAGTRPDNQRRSEEHTSEIQSLLRISYAVFCLKKNNTII